MKKVLIFLLMLIFSLTFSKDIEECYLLSMYVGDVRVSMDNGNKWEKPEVEMKLYESSMVKTGSESYCDVMMPKRGVFRIVENSLILIDKLKKSLEEIKVKKGRVLLNITYKLKEGEKFSVQTDVAIAAVRGTKFIIETDGKILKCKVGEGSVVLRRNIRLPVDVEDEELLSKLEVVANANQEIELTLDENKALENLLSRAKNNLSEMKKILSDSQRNTQKKLRMVKNVRRLIEELNMFEEMKGDNETEDEED
ncbi:MAG: FecR domain-containing protein [Brevinematia bacterium]